MKRQMLEPHLPWWRVALMWLVIGGPLLVVVAGVITTVIAVRGGDVPLRRSAAPQADTPGAATLTPATQARNHAVTARH
jgi:hypothetical protein